MEKTLKLFKAIAAFQQEVPAIHEGTKGYGYTYADLTQILSVINPIMKKNKLGFTQLLNGNSIKTVIFHTESGETIESEVAIPDNVTLKNMNKFQVTGSAITYYRRYSLSAILGLVTDSDNDTNTPKPNTNQTPPTKPTPQNTERKGNTEKKWFTSKEDFEKAKLCTNPKQLENLFEQFQFRNKEWQEELQEIYIKLKTKNQ